MTDLPCEIVRDLLPTYLDSLTSEASAALLEAHLAACPDCRAALERMRESTPPAAAERTELDFLKKNRRHTRLVAVVGFLSALLLVLCTGLLKSFVIGEEASIAGNSGLATELVVNPYSVGAAGSLQPFSGKSIRSVHIQEIEPGSVEVRVRVVKESFLFTDKEFRTVYHTQTPVERVEWSDYWLWEHGKYLP